HRDAQISRPRLHQVATGLDVTKPRHRERRDVIVCHQQIIDGPQSRPTTSREQLFCRLEIVAIEHAAAVSKLRSCRLCGRMREDLWRCALPGWGCRRDVVSVRPRHETTAVRTGGLEPPRCYSLAPETSASTNSATFAFWGGTHDTDGLRSQDPGARRPA